MLSFKTWCEQHQPNKPWQGKKEEILTFWKNIPPSLLIRPTNLVPSNYKGSTYAFDGVRITGSTQFINSVMSRLKDITNYEDKNTNLFLRYHQQVDRNTEYPLPNSFVFYAQVKKRDQDGVSS